MRLTAAVLIAGFLSTALAGQAHPAPRAEQLKQDALLIDARADLVQRLTDQVFSYGELGFQETETSRYLSDLLRRERFTIEMAMATPIAHKGALAGAKATALTVLDAPLTPGLVDSSWTWFREVQTKDTHYQPLIRPEDTPPIESNRSTMDRYRGRMRSLYFDPSRYRTYLDQLGVRYPVLPDTAGRCDYQPPAR